ncbi:hypothetical protein ACOZ38_41235 [Sphaerisporangium viridialbum]|uniref:hypothetical protein n=1 Tax=Sphaerisporangium viridialbum TaxID=46189 RepID=UPI003C73AAC2
MKEEKLIHLVRLAWDLNKRGVSTAIELSTKTEPVLLVPQAPEPMRIMTLVLQKTWFFTWGRGEGQRVRALTGDAVDRVWEAAQ